MHDPQQAPTPSAHRAHTWRRYLRFWGPRAAADVDDELRFHIEMRVRDYIERGLSEPEARDATLRRLGDLVTARSECVTITTRRERRMTRAQLVDAFLQDARFAFRTLGRQKGWTAVAILTLALGIGANTAVFSVVNSLLLHPLPYPNADRIMVIFQEPSQGNSTGMNVMVTPRPSIVRGWLEGSRSFEAIEPFHTTDMALRIRGGEASTVHGASVLPSFPRFTGQTPLLGRMFTAAEQVEKAPVVVLGESVWRNRFGSDPAVLGTMISLDDVSRTIIGVMPAAFRLPRLTQDLTDVWLPLDMRQENQGLSVIGRLRPASTSSVASRELDSLTARVDRAEKSAVSFTTKLVPPSQMVSFRDSLLLLTVAVALVLLIACANVAHLLLARAATRQRELAIRAALGAGRARLFRQLVTESLVLAGAGCIGGLVVGWMGMRVLVALRPDSLAELGMARIDTTTLLVTIALAVATGIVFGVIGAVQSARHSTHESLKAGTLSASHTRRHHHLRSLLVVSEMALSATLLVGATLLVRSVVRLQTLDPGFRPAGLFGIQMILPEKSYSTEASRAAFHRELAERARAIPGVEAVTIASGTPPSRSFLIGALEIEGEPPPKAGTTSFLDFNNVEPSYFRVMGIRLVQGTTFGDSSARSHEVIVNEGMARKHWRRPELAIGKRLRVTFNGQGDWMTIVGVAADASTGGLTADASAPFLYMGEGERYQPSLIVRTRGGASPLAALRGLVASMDRRLPPQTVTDVERALKDSIARPRFTMLLLTAFTVLALVLAAVGLYGVMAYAVSQRTREIGIRIALGATRRNIARAVIGQGVMLAVCGIVIGLVGAHWATRLIEKMLYGIPRTDPASFAAGSIVLLATALLACVVPMRRAVAIDPLLAMRAE
jgi:putative ABC transport system permease protein